MIRSISLTNFKSFKQLNLTLGNFNVFVGANAAGKSNVLQAFKFIGDIASHGLENAIAIQGGFKFLRNASCESQEVVKVEIAVESTESFYLPIRTEGKARNYDFTHCNATEVKHSLTLEPSGTTFAIKEDLFVCKFRAQEKKLNYVLGVISAAHTKDKVHFGVELESKKFGVDKDMLRFVEGVKLPERSALAFSSEPIGLMSIPRARATSGDLDIAYYDFDPRLSKQAVRISGFSDLDESADNLAVVIQKILSDDKQKERLMERIRDLLPHVRSLDLEHFSDSSLLMNLRERFVSDFEFPASLVSNGTVSVIATLVAVLFQKSSMVIMEEPERNIHPYLIERLLNTIKEASAKKQILISTHSPTILDQCSLEDLFLVRRNSEGVSYVTQPKDSEVVQSFLASDFGMGRLYETKLLEL
jgi:predicted ATPase